MSGKQTSPLLPYLSDVTARRAKGETWGAIAKALTAAVGEPVSAKRIQELHAYYGGEPPKPKAESAPFAARPKDVRDLLDIPPRPFAVPILSGGKAPAVLRGWRRSLVYGDTHFPHQDDTALACVRAIYQHSEADRLIHVGDLGDCYTISRFSKDPNRRFSLQDEIDLMRAHLHQMAQLNPKAERWLLEGNHEDRLRKLIWDLPGGAAELARLTAFRKAITWPMLLGLEEIGWRFVPSHEQTRTPILPKLIVKHGTVVRKWSGFTAKGEWERYGKGGLSGHTHRLGKFYHRDHNGSHLWMETGCTCTVDPEYMVDPDWQQGCVLVTHTKDGERYHAEDIYIEAGRAMWRDKEIAA